MRSFAEPLKCERARVGLSQATLAGRAACHFTHLSRPEAGERLPSERLVVDLARALGVDEDAADRLRLAAGFAPQGRRARRALAAAPPRRTVRRRAAARVTAGWPPAR